MALVKDENRVFELGLEALQISLHTVDTRLPVALLEFGSE